MIPLSFRLSHIILGFAIALMAAVLLTTLGYATWQLVEPIGVVEGFLGPVESVRTELGENHYAVTVQDEANQLRLVRLYPDGRILTRLENNPPSGFVTVRYRAGYAVALETADETIQDSASARWLFLLIIGGTLLILVIFFRPSLIEQALDR